jgi:sugar transferase (PEP-CTERM/EpsH1 system associated)
MKILFACHRFPFPPNRGGKIRPFNMIRHLSQKHEVFVASLAHTQQELDEGAGLSEYCAEIYAEVVPEKLRWLQAVRALPSTTPSSVAYFSSSRLRERVKAAARRVSFDTVIVHCAFAAQYVLQIPAAFRLMDFGDLDSGKWLDYSEWRWFPLSQGYSLEGHKLRRYERQLAAAFDYCTLTTQGELEEFKKLEVDRPHSVIPNGVDASYFHPNGGAGQAKRVVVFLGRMDYYPNIDGVLHFTKSVLPTVRAAVPDVEFRIIGSNPTPAIERLRQVPGVIVTGYVPDVRPFLNDAVVSVAPLRMARGTQNKILESMAMGIPVVATSDSAKGVDAIPEQHILIGNTPDAFARQVIRILMDRKRLTDLSKVGRERVEQVHLWPRSMELLDAILNYSSRRPADRYKH